MAFRVEHTPLSALLGLGSIAGEGMQAANDRAERLRQIQVLSDIAARQNDSLVQQQQFAQTRDAQAEANRIQTALAMNKLQSENQQAEAERQQQNIQQQAQMQFNAQQAAQRQMNVEKDQALEQKKFETTQTQQTAQDAAVDQMIDQLYPPGSAENTHLKLQYKASGRIPAPQSESQARNLNALIIARKTMVDPFGEALPGKEAQLANIDQQIASLTGNIGQAGAAAQPTAGAAPVTARNPQTGQRIQYDPASGQWFPIQ